MMYVAVACAVVAVVLLGRAMFVVVRVVGISMEPTYHHGDRVLVLRVPRLALRRPGAVVVFAPAPGAAPGWLIKRVVARPGDRTPDGVPARVPGGRVPRRHLVVYGDNGGHDSRDFGYLPLSRVRGVVLADLSTTPAPRDARPGPPAPPLSVRSRPRDAGE
ncbi:S26 family signal peptidase [Plantactinospora sp. GCM10030261]|uniref:S26 family signal peptidase n=1 Tax=Plantactinospora sp. GCM10030261 TaxID=3273420 RepID=UPI00360A7C44